MGVLSNSVVVASSLGSGRSPSRVYTFGPFQLRTETGELKKGGVRIKLQTRPCQVLAALLERPGELVTREELRAKLWPAGTFVDFESGLNTATNRLRAALGDSADSPRYVETLPRLGYRFICPVVKSDEAAASASATVDAAGGMPDLQAQILPSGFGPSGFGNLIQTEVLPRNEWQGTAAQTAGKRFPVALVSIAALVTSVLALAYIYPKTLSMKSQPALRQLTFRPGVVNEARFAPDSQAVIYTAKWDSGDRQTNMVQLKNLASQTLGLGSGELAAVSRRGDLALSYTDPSSLDHRVRLSRVPLNGGSPEVIAEGTRSADWAPDGGAVAVVREEGVRSIVEFPAGNPLYASDAWINCLRVSPRGDQVAFLEHPARDDSGGHVRIVDRKRRTRVLTYEWNGAEGLAWSPSGDEVWFTASKNGARASLFAVSSSGRIRQISDTPSSLRLLDISKDGRILVATDDMRVSMTGEFPSEQAETDLSKFDMSHVEDISQDGNFVLFTEGGDAGGSHYTAYIHDHKAHSTLPIGAGRGLAISPDEEWVLTMDPQDRSALMLTELSSRKQRKMSGYGFEYQWARFLASGRELLVGGAFPGKPLQICTQNPEGGEPQPWNGSRYLDQVVISADGTRLAGLDGHSQLSVFDIGRGQFRQILPSSDGFPVAWNKTGSNLFSLIHRGPAYEIVKTNIETGKTETWRTITPAPTTGFAGVAAIAAAPEAAAYVYSSKSELSHLYIVDGWS